MDAMIAKHRSDVKTSRTEANRHRNLLEGINAACPVSISMPTFSSGNVIFFQGMKIPLVRTSDLTIQFRSDLRYVAMLGTFLSYERF